ncbi:MAG: YiiX/YebB-like N1pC/P60 family cysteine hydrolase [Syntrophomonadaceae bacterium]|nr:YiiX/YebB-like N1pC/P60 family cysteine hydrolase [Syntrophomonadaceae bacterium]MDD3889194.1 YiiX/YebB-like N1pC/P60 family cysteine hydrolase [Syntrophomonadaceae bacterium]MDD4549811.1 YiiX/YebB-like N1pC/P60 family cysteine hydrolase [Syntrophomonadaceae bacterium]
MNINRHRQICIILMIFPLLSIMLALAIACENSHIFYNRNASMYVYLQGVKQGNFGYGFDINHNNGISFSGLEPGDIILGGYPGCAYGRFSHAGLYIGNGQVIESFGELGVNIQPIEHYRDYTEICLLRVNLPEEIKKDAVKYTMKYEGAMFYPVAFKPGDRLWNCSKIMWQAYIEQGVDLALFDDFWIAPDNFYYSSQVSIIREKGRVK